MGKSSAGTGLNPLAHAVLAMCDPICKLPFALTQRSCETRSTSMYVISKTNYPHVTTELCNKIGGKAAVLEEHDNVAAKNRAGVLHTNLEPIGPKTTIRDGTNVLSL